MNISALNTPVTPPYDYQNHSSMDSSYHVDKNYTNLFFERQPLPDHHQHHHQHIETSSTISDNETVISNHSAFRRVSSMSMPSPPELLIDTSEDDEELEEAASHTPGIHYDRSSNNRKSVPHRSPSNLVDHKSVIFQIEENHTSKILGGKHGLLWSVRQRVSMARRQQKTRLSAPRPQRRVVKAMRIHIPRLAQYNTFYDNDVSPTSNNRESSSHQHLEPTHHFHRHEPVTVLHNSIEQPIMVTEQQQVSWQSVKKSPSTNGKQAIERKKTSASSSTATTAVRKNSSGTHHASSGRPSRVKGPCQACHETSDGCMRKAFNWPFPTSTIFNDKGKPFVYLCNKCGLRYNKSGGCVCRHCRWVLCKEEKRKAMQLIDQMRRSRPDGRVDPEEDIENFACSPKYWSCGRPWKVGWVLNSQHDDEDEEMLMDHHSSPSLSEATL